MLKRTCCLFVQALFILSTHSAFGQNTWLTDKQFQNSGAGEFVGTIQNVQVSAATPGFESGTVQLQVNQVVTGTLTASQVTFPYQRALVSTDNAANWDIVGPLGSSLKTLLGVQLVVFFNTSAGTYSIFPASNSVQAVTNGVLLGTLRSISLNRDGEPTVDIQVNETIYGWVSGNSVTLPFATSLLKKTFLGGLLKLSLPLEILDANYCSANQGKQFVIAFSNGTIIGLQIASQSFLDTLAKLEKS